MIIEPEKKPIDRFNDKDYERADQMFGKGKWEKHICPDVNNVWAIHRKGAHKQDNET